MRGECLRGRPDSEFLPVDRDYGSIARAVVEYRWVALGDGCGVVFSVWVLSSSHHEIALAVVQLTLERSDCRYLLALNQEYVGSLVRDLTFVIMDAVSPMVARERS